MTLKQRLDADIKNAMLSRERFLTETLRSLKSVILSEEVARQQREDGLDDATIEALFAKEAKKRDEAAGLFEQGGNQEAADKERAEKQIILQYLPKQMGEDELRVIVADAIQQTGANGMQDMGKVIGAVKTQVGNKADGAVVAKIVKETLAG